MKHARHILYLLIAAAFATGCWGWVEYFDVTADEIKVPEGISDVIPQEGTTLTIDLTYEYVPKTKFEPGEDWKQYRYRALIDGWEYCYGVVSGEFETAVIPIMANDTHSPASIVIEGSKALDYEENPKHWEDWHELYRGTQECLPATETPKYEGLKDMRLKVTVDGKSFLFDIRNTGAGEAFKRQIAGRTVTLPVCRDTFLFISDDTEGFQKQLREKVPPCYAKAHYLHKAGDIHIDKYGLMEICLKDKETFGYDTVIGSVRPEDLKALKALYPGYHNQEPATMTLSLIN